MKKIILFLAILLLVAVPATAKVVVTAKQVGTTADVNIMYDVNGADATVGVVAFAINITADNGANIIDINGFKKNGQSTSGSKGYGIFPGSIIIDGNVASATYGQVLSYGDPIADINDPDNPGQKNSPSIVVELGALYDHSASPSAAPALSGLLCVVTVDGDCNVTPSVNSFRAGIVMEDGSAPTETVMVPGKVTIPACGTCRGDWNNDGNVVLTTDLMPLLGKLSAANYFVGKYDYNEADTVLYPVLQPWNPCADWNGDDSITLTTDLMPMLGKQAMANYFLGQYDYPCCHATIDPCP